MAGNVTSTDGPLRCDDPQYPDLLRQVRSGNCVAFIGSGPSTSDLLYPEWGEAVSQVCLQCGLPAMTQEEKENVDVLLDRADEARARNEAQYCDTLKEIFGKPIVHTTRFYDLLMDAEFRSYVTANVDPLLADKSRSGKNRLGEVYTYPALPYDCIEKRSIYYLHGLVDVGVVPLPHQIVLGRQDFSEAYDESSGTLRSFLHQLFSFQTIVFVGCTLREPPIERILESCRKARGRMYTPSRAPQRFALLPMRFQRDTRNTGSGMLPKRDQATERDEQKRLQDLGIVVVRYDPRDELHSGLVEIVEEWCQLPPIPKRQGFDPESLS